MFLGNLSEEILVEKGQIMSEEERVRDIIGAAARGESMGNKLMYHKPTRSLRPTSFCSDKDPDNSIAITNQDRHLWWRR